MLPNAAAAALVVLALAASDAGAAEAASCLSPAETEEWVQARRIVAPVEAILAARLAVPQSDILRASLCRGGSGMVYMLLALRQDGRFVHVTIDAPSGKVAGLR